MSKSSKTRLVLSHQHPQIQLLPQNSARVENAVREENLKANSGNGPRKFVKVDAMESNARMESAEAEVAVVTPSLKQQHLHKRLLLLQPQILPQLFEAITWYKRANNLSISQFEIN